MGVGRFRLALAAGFLVVLVAATAAGADFAWDPEATFDPPEPADLYGRAVELDEPTLVTGAPGDDTLLPNAGAVWVHSRAGDGSWSLVVKLNATGAAPGEQLGTAVAVEDDTLVAGAPFADDGQGAVYVFNRSPGGLWTQSARLVPADSPGPINFGRAGHVAFAVGLAVLLIHWARGRSPWLIAGVTAVLGLLLPVVWISLPTLGARIDETRSELHAAVVEHDYDSNLGGRLAAMHIAREVFRQDPILGTGVGGNIPAMRQAIDARHGELKSSIYWYRHYHNQYAQVATELGIVGLLALGWIFWELIRRRRRRPETDAAALVLATTYLVAFLGEPFFHKQITLILFALFAGFISAEDLEKETSR